MTNWLERSIPWKVSSFKLERAALFLLIGFSVVLGGGRVLGEWEAFLMLFFLPAIAWIAYLLETGTARFRLWTNMAILAVMALFVLYSVSGLWGMKEGGSWNPFSLLLVLQMFLGFLVFDRRYLPLVFEVTLFAVLMLLLTAGNRTSSYWVGFLFTGALLFYLRFSFATSQWIHTVDRKKGPWGFTAPDVSYRQILSVVVEAGLVLALGLGLGVMMSSRDWKITPPAPLMEVLQENFNVDPRAFGWSLAGLESETGLLPEEREQLPKPEEEVPEEEMPEEISDLPEEEQESKEFEEMAEPAPEQPEQKEKLPEEKQELEETEAMTELELEPEPEKETLSQPIWQGILSLLRRILWTLLAPVLFVTWIYFWIWRARMRNRWARLRAENPKEFLKEWLNYLRGLLEKYGIANDLFLSPAEYVQGVLGKLKIEFQEANQVNRVLLKGWYSSAAVTEGELVTVGKIHQTLLAILEKQGSWRQRLWVYCRRVPW